MSLNTDNPEVRAFLEELAQMNVDLDDLDPKLLAERAQQLLNSEPEIVLPTWGKGEIASDPKWFAQEAVRLTEPVMPEAKGSGAA